MQVCTSRQRDNHASTPPLSFLQAGCPSCCPTNSVKALKAILLITILHCNIYIASTCLEHCVFLCELHHINVVNNSVHRNSYYYKLRLFWMTYSFFNVEIPELWHYLCNSRITSMQQFCGGSRSRCTHHSTTKYTKLIHLCWNVRFYISRGHVTLMSSKGSKYHSFTMLETDVSKYNF